MDAKYEHIPRAPLESWPPSGPKAGAEQIAKRIQTPFLLLVSRCRMHGASPDTGSSMISPDHALEHMSVEKAWTLLDTLSSQVAGKQTELQVGRA